MYLAQKDIFLLILLISNDKKNCNLQVLYLLENVLVVQYL